MRDEALIRETYRSGQIKVLVWTIIGYALFYFVRKNLSSAMPVMEKELHIDKVQLGTFLTLHGVIYGISKFGNGFLGDRANSRTFLAVGLLLSAATNIVFGLSSAVIVFGVVWMLNGWFQGMGFPPCARLMTHWFRPKKLATMMSIWNTSHSIGGGLIVVLGTYLAARDWRLCFLVPAGLAIVVAVLLLIVLPDTPAAEGLPDVEGSTRAAGDGAAVDDRTDIVQTEEAFRSFVVRHVFSNPYIWIIAVANFFVYTIRFAIFDWGISALVQAKGVKLENAGWVVFSYEISGIIGMLLFGWATDRIFGGRGARACVFSMLGAVGASACLWSYHGHSIPIYLTIFCLAGFFIYGPQALVGIAVANLATKRAAATAVGLTGLFGYASTLLSGIGMGWLVTHYGWDAGFASLVGIGVLGVITFLLAWPAKPDGYGAAAQGFEVVPTSPASGNVADADK